MAEFKRGFINNPRFLLIRIDKTHKMVFSDGFNKEVSSKNGFWFKVKAAANIKPEEYFRYFEDLI